MISKDLIKSAAELINRAIEISSESVVDIFTDYAPHVQTLDIRIYVAGWSRRESPTRKTTINLDNTFADSIIQKELEYINSLVKE